MADSGTANETIAVAAVQMCSGNDKSKNLAITDHLLQQAASQHCRLAVLPENFAFVGIADDDKLAHAEQEGEGPIQAFLSDAARRHGMWIVAGSVPLKSARPDHCFGASLAFDPHGRLRGSYRKMHLFDVNLPEHKEHYRESATLARGRETLVVDTVIGSLGLSICYDVRFPELYRCLVDGGATAFSIPAAFTKVTGAAHWKVLLRARAIENLAYVIAPGQYGRHPNGRETYGHTMIVDPWGRVLAEQPEGDAVVIAVVDPALPGKLRREFPVLQHRQVTSDE